MFAGEGVGVGDWFGSHERRVNRVVLIYRKSCARQQLKRRDVDMPCMRSESPRCCKVHAVARCCRYVAGLLWMCSTCAVHVHWMCSICAEDLQRLRSTKSWISKI